MKPIFGRPKRDGLPFVYQPAGLRPYLRGPGRCMSTQPWTSGNILGFSTAEGSNAFYRRNLAAG